MRFVASSSTEAIHDLTLTAPHLAAELAIVKRLQYAGFPPTTSRRQPVPPLTQASRLADRSAVISGCTVKIQNEGDCDVLGSHTDLMAMLRYVTLCRYLADGQ